MFCAAYNIFVFMWTFLPLKISLLWMMTDYIVIFKILHCLCSNLCHWFILLILSRMAILFVLLESFSFLEYHYCEWWRITYIRRVPEYSRIGKSLHIECIIVPGFKCLIQVVSWHIFARVLFCYTYKLWFRGI